MAEKETREKKALYKGEHMVCEVCGLSVKIDENFAYTENATLMCCGKSMQPKTEETSAAKQES